MYIQVHVDMRWIIKRDHHQKEDARETNHDQGGTPNSDVQKNWFFLQSLWAAWRETAMCLDEKPLLVFKTIMTHRIRCHVIFWVPQHSQQLISNEFNVFPQQIVVHARKLLWECFYIILLYKSIRKGNVSYEEQTSSKGLFYLHCLGDHESHLFLRWSVRQILKKKAHKFCMNTLVSRYELIRKTEPRHNSSLFQPKYSSKWSREKYSLDNSKGD